MRTATRDDMIMIDRWGGFEDVLPQDLSELGLSILCRISLRRKFISCCNSEIARRAKYHDPKTLLEAISHLSSQRMDLG
jgi:hypothetical protein